MIKKKSYRHCEARSNLRSLLYILLLSLHAISSAGNVKISVDFPALAGKSVALMLKHGTGSDTVYTGRLDGRGTAEINIPAAYDGYSGMARIKTGDNVFEFIVNGEDVRMKCTEEYPNGSSVTFDGSAENVALQSWYAEQSVRMAKIELTGEMLNLYEENDDFHTRLEQEYWSLVRRQTEFESAIASSPLYAAKFISFDNFVERRISPLVVADSAQMDAVRKYVIDSLDVANLYTSGLWFDALNGLLAVYGNKTPYHARFINDMSRLLSRIETPRIYAHLVENLFAICESVGWNDMEEQLACLVGNDRRTEELTPRMQQLLAAMKLVAGSAAPPLTHCTLYPKTLIVFHESGCGQCENEMRQLTVNYPLLKENGYEVITVSSDTDTAVFRGTSDAFPWKDKYCDMQGITGADFRNYGVTGTPTIFVVENGKVTGRHARLNEIKLSF